MAAGRARAAAGVGAGRAGEAAGSRAQRRDAGGRGPDGAEALDPRPAPGGSAPRADAAVRRSRPSWRGAATVPALREHPGAGARRRTRARNQDALPGRAAAARDPRGRRRAPHTRPGLGGERPTSARYGPRHHAARARPRAGRALRGAGGRFAWGRPGRRRARRGRRRQEPASWRARHRGGPPGCDGTGRTLVRIRADPAVRAVGRRVACGTHRRGH